MEVFALTKENVEACYPLLPEEYQKQEQDEAIVLLGAAETDEAGVHHACGTMVLTAVNEETLLLNWILVEPARQRRSIGTALLEQAQNIADQMNMQIFCVFADEAEQKGSLYSFFEKHGFVLRKREAKTYAISVGQIAEEPFFQREWKNSNKVMTLQEVSEKMIAEMNKALAEQGVLLGGYISKEDAISDVSVVYVENGKISACAIFREMGGTIVELSYAYAGVKGTMQLPALLLRARELLSEKYAAETELLIPCVTDASRKLVEMLLPSAVVVTISYSARWLPKAAVK